MKQKVISRKHYIKHKDEYLARNNVRRQKSLAFVRRYKRMCGCRLCHIAFPEVLSFHHLGDKDKSIAKACGDGWSQVRLKKEIRKCVVLCENCHRLVHAGILSI